MIDAYLQLHDKHYGTRDDHAIAKALKASSSKQLLLRFRDVCCRAKVCRHVQNPQDQLHLVDCVWLVRTEGSGRA